MKKIAIIAGISCAGIFVFLSVWLNPIAYHFVTYNHPVYSDEIFYDQFKDDSNQVVTKELFTLKEALNSPPSICRLRNILRYSSAKPTTSHQTKLVLFTIRVDGLVEPLILYVPYVGIPQKGRIGSKKYDEFLSKCNAAIIRWS